jgi:hypothetical protein
VYRQSPFALQYYVYRVWAVKPARMVTDLVYKHLETRNLVSSVTRRFDEGPKPDYELSGVIEALEEYDSEELWFAHLAIRMNLVRLSDGQSVYTRRFDIRKRVYKHTPENVIRELSALMEYHHDPGRLRYGPDVCERVRRSFEYGGHRRARDREQCRGNQVKTGRSQNRSFSRAFRNQPGRRSFSWCFFCLMRGFHSCSRNCPRPFPAKNFPRNI